MDLESIFSEAEKDALAVLSKRGFRPYTEAKLEDVKELSGRRHRTFRNQGRYDLILALKKADPAAKVDQTPPAQKPATPLENLTVAQLRGMAASRGISTSGMLKADIIAALTET